LVTPKLAYFFNYAARAALMPFLVLYYERVGLTGWQIGILAGLPPLLALIVAPLVAGVADATGRHKQLLLGAVGGSILVALLFPLATSFLALIPLVIFWAMTLEPIMPLTDKAVLDLLGERREEYGKQRLWGAVGWGAMAPVAGLLIDWFGLQWSFIVFAVLMVGVFVSVVRLPMKSWEETPHWGRSLKLFLANPHWTAFLILVFAAGIGTSTIHIYFFLYLERLGASGTLMGMSLTVATLSELVVMYGTAGWIRRWGTRRLLLLALGIYALRLLLFAIITDPWIALWSQLLHGPSFALLWVAGVAHADRLAPPGLRTTAQGIFTGTLFGVGAVVGASAGGILIDRVGVAGLYGWIGGLLLVALLPLGMLLYRTKLEDGEVRG
jgi:MFS transporter, PPP family, 3-phenylpropionic acid transporter